MRNVVSRRVAVKPRVEARTTEIDCRQIAKLMESQESAMKPIVDLDAEIEVVATLSEAPARGSSRFAHTLQREAPELPAPPARPKLELPLAAPKLETMPALALAELAAEPTPVLEPEPMPEPPRAPARSRGWIIFATVSVVVALVALVGVAQL